MKYLRLFLAFSLCLLLVPVYGTSAAEKPITKTVCINVAENKPITSNGIHNSLWPIENLVDGDRTTFVPAEYTADSPVGAGNEEIVIDLQRRYKVDRIEIFGSVDTDREGGRMGFALFGANRADFSDAVRLGGMDSADSDLFPALGCYTAQLNGQKAYRYIKFQRTVWGYYGYAEFKVFANQTVTEVAQGKTATANYWYESMDTFAPSKAVNGTNKDDTDCWLAESGSGTTDYYWWRVDLGKPMHIGMIEMEGRNFSNTVYEDNAVTRKYNDVYGSNANADDAVLAQNAELVGIGDYQRLIKTTENNLYDGEQQFPAVTTSADHEMFQSNVDESEAFQYLTYHKSYLTFAALGAFRAYVIHPEVNSSSLSGQDITVDFSDEMDDSFFTADNVSVYVDDVLTEVTHECPDAYTLKLKLPKMYYNSKVKVKLAKEIESKKEIELAKAYTLNFDMPPAVEVTKTVFSNAKDGTGDEITALSGLSQLSAQVILKNNTPDQPETAVVLLLLYDSNYTVVKADEKRVNILPGQKEEPLLGFDLPENTEGCHASVFIWRDYHSMEPWMTHISID